LTSGANTLTFRQSSLLFVHMWYTGVTVCIHEFGRRLASKTSDHGVGGCGDCTANNNGSRFDYVNYILTGISSPNIHRLQCVQNSLARVVARSATNTTSALNSLHWLPIQQRINFKLVTQTCPPFAPQRWLSMHLIFTTFLYSIASASLCLPQSPLPTSYQH